MLPLARAKLHRSRRIKLRFHRRLPKLCNFSLIVKGSFYHFYLNVKTETRMSLPSTRRKNFRLVQIETNCRRHFKVHSK